ncbi:Cytochrome P450 CYP749A22 [Linum perenne]
MIRKRGEEEEDSYGSDFLGLLLKAHHEAYESKKITVDDVVDECKTFYLAGQESCNILLSWVMLLLSIHTDGQEEARKEVDAIFGLETPNPDGISKLKTVIKKLLPPSSENLSLSRSTQLSPALALKSAASALDPSRTRSSYHTSLSICGQVRLQPGENVVG